MIRELLKVWFNSNGVILLLPSLPPLLINKDRKNLQTKYNSLDSCVAYNVDVDQLDNILNINNDEN
jgi:hypothetical protein